LGSATSKPQKSPLPDIRDSNLKNRAQRQSFPKNFGIRFAGLKNYLHQNRVEAIGFTRRESRDMLDICQRFGLEPPIA
jgi:hypothetical protein